MNKLTIRFLCSNLIKDEILATALIFWLAFLHSLFSCSSRVSLILILILKNFYLRTSRYKYPRDDTYLRTSHYKYPRDDIFITKKKVKFIWIHFHTVIPKSQSKAFHHISLITSSFELPPIANGVLSIICITY